VPPERYSQDIYFGFVCHYLRYVYPRRQKKKKPPLPRAVRLLDWTSDTTLNVDELQSDDMMRRRYASATTLQHHWPSAWVTRATHKHLQFSLDSPRLLMSHIENAVVTAHHGASIQCVVSNCRIGVIDVSKFNGLVIYIPGQPCPVELPLECFTPDSDGRRTFNLTTLAAVDQFCYVDTLGSEVTLLFGSQPQWAPGTLRLRGQPGSQCTVLLEVQCFLEYWVVSSPAVTQACSSLSHPPFKCRYVDDPYSIANSYRHDVSLINGTCSHCQLIEETIEVLKFIYAMDMVWHPGHDRGAAPRVYLNGALLSLMPPFIEYLKAGAWWTLYFGRRPLAQFMMPTLTDCEFVFRPVISAEVHFFPFDAMRQYVY
jgi:hypothetical protein